MTPGDFDFTLRMTDIEKWGYLRADFERHIDFEPDGCFIARQDNEYVGMITSTSYDFFGFIGGLIVPREYRGHGIGEMLMKKGIEYLRQKGVQSIELDAVFPAVPLYRRLGFRDKYLSLRFCRNPKKADISEKPHLVSSIDDIIKFDKEKTDLDRGRMLAAFFEQMPESIYIDKQSEAFGYAIVKPCAGNFSMIGPMVCNDIQNARNLLESIIVRYWDRALLVGVPEMKESFVDLLTRSGFDFWPPSLRMYLGDGAEYEKHVYAILSPGQG